MSPLLNISNLRIETVPRGGAPARVLLQDL